MNYKYIYIYILLVKRVFSNITNFVIALKWQFVSVYLSFSYEFIIFSPIFIIKHIKIVAKIVSIDILLQKTPFTLVFEGDDRNNIYLAAMMLIIAIANFTIDSINKLQIN